MQARVDEERKQLEIERKQRMERVKKQREEQEKNPAAPASGPATSASQPAALSSSFPNSQASLQQISQPNRMISINGTTESGIIQTVQLNV